MERECTSHAGEQKWYLCLSTLFSTVMEQVVTCTDSQNRPASKEMNSRDNTVAFTWISFRSLSHRFWRGSMKFCLTSISSESFTSANRFIDSPASSSASPLSEKRKRKGGGEQASRLNRAKVCGSCMQSHSAMIPSMCNFCPMPKTSTFLHGATF